MRVVFPYFAQLHQVFHSLPIAAEMAIRHPDIDVHVAGIADVHLPLIRELLANHAPGARVQLDALRLPLLRHLPAKKRTMFKNRHYFRSFDAIVTPERTSLFMRRLGLGRTRLIWTRHGAGDRAIGFAKDVDQFDYVLMAGRKIEERLLAAQLIRPGHYSSGVYAKFDWLRKRPPSLRLFDNDRPAVLYNPHFDPKLSSWPAFGAEILEYFARSDRYNLIFAPHVRLFDPPSKASYRPFERYMGLSHMHIDLGSVRSIDMSYIGAADLYLGDVSSQVAEFLCRPRPCLFLNAHGAAWQNNPDYQSWTLGPVIDRVDQLTDALEQAFAGHPGFVAEQWRYVAETFEVPADGSSSARGADAIVRFLRKAPPDVRIAA